MCACQLIAGSRHRAACPTVNQAKETEHGLWRCAEDRSYRRAGNHCVYDCDAIDGCDMAGMNMRSSEWHKRLAQKRAKGGRLSKSESVALEHAKGEERLRKLRAIGMLRMNNVFARLFDAIRKELEEMGRAFQYHSELCGCERCAKEWDKEHPRRVYDIVDDPNVLDCGCSAIAGCNCWEFDHPDYEED